jgi:hypothetical protein
MDSIRQEMAMDTQSQGMQIDNSLMAAAKGTSLERCAMGVNEDRKDDKQIIAESKEASVAQREFSGVPPLTSVSFVI